MRKVEGLSFCFRFLGIFLEPGKETSSPARSSLSLLALLGILGSAVAIVRLLKGTQPNQVSSKAIHPHETTSDPSNSAPRQAAVVAQIAPSPDQCASPNRSKRDAPLWEKLAAVAIALGTIGLLVVNIFLWCATNKAAKAALASAKAAESANRIAEGQLRPWVDVEVVKIGPITFDSSGGAQVELAVKVTNVGHSPAIAVNIVPDAVNGTSVGNVDQIQEKECSQFSADPHAETWGPALFPTRDFTRTIGIPVPKSEVEKTRNNFLPSIIGCVDYMLGPKGEHHQTNFFYTVIYEMTTNGPIPIKKGRNVSADKITFQRMFEIGNGAN